MKKLLLISNSTLHGGGYLDHCAGEIKKFLGEIENVLFIPYARPSGMTHEEYTKIARERFKKMGYNLSGIHEYDNPRDAVKSAESIFIGGGNTFVLIDGLYKNNLIDIIRKRVSEGIPYIGTSAGSNVACKSINTTNDMPIIYPPSFEGLNLVSFNINPHYIDPDLNSKHMGETRVTRIKEFHFYNDTKVVGLREGAILLINNKKMTLKGSTGARLFKKDGKQEEYKQGDSLDFLLR